MKRGLLAPALLLLMGVGPVAADYLFIKVDLNKVNFGGGQADKGNQPIGPGGANMQGGFPGQLPNPMGDGNQGRSDPGPMAPNMQAMQQAMMAKQTNMQGMPGQSMPAGDMEMASAEISSHVVLAFVELKGKLNYVTQPPQMPRIIEVDHRWGRKGRFPAVPLVEYTFVKKDSVGKTFAKDYGKDLLEAKDAERVYYAATWALAHGLTKEFHGAMEALAKADPKHLAVTNYRRVQTDLKKPLTSDDPATQGLLGDLKGEGFRLAVSDAGHYGILTKLATTPQNEAVLKRRLSRFEESYDNFFHWFALQENAQQPPMPKHRLYVLLLEDKQDFHSKHAWWGSQPMVADAFTPRRDNLIVLSAKRLDENFAIFEKNVQILLTTFRASREELISGAVWERLEAKNNVQGYAAVQTLVLMQKAMEEEAERASISHAASRQLLVATDILPRFVNVPQWTQFGVASYFDSPYGALYSGVGLPSWTNLVSFKYYRRTNKLGGSPYEALMRTISDRFFRDAQRAEEDFKDQTDKDKKDDKVREQTDIARGTAWALSYYLLLTKKMPELARYTQELNSLPRDLELDERALQACFARAFNLSDAKDPNRLDPSKTRAFAEAWFSRMLEVSLEVNDADDVFTAYRFPAPRRRATNQQQQPGMPQGLNPMPMPLLPGANPNN